MTSEVNVILFDGTLGAGKTTLIKAFAKNALGLADITSPTFSVIDIHIGENAGKKVSLAHMDLYRLKNAQEFFHLGGPEYLDDPDCLCLVEWPEVALSFLTQFGLVRIERRKDGSRKIVLSLETVNEEGNESSR